MDVDTKELTPETAPPAAVEPGSEFYEGVVRKISFLNQKTGFGVLRVDPAGATTHPATTLVGVLPSTVRTGFTFIARGTWQSHEKFGKQFRAYTFIEKEPTSEEAVLRYLASGSVKGLGEVLAQRIVSHFGADTLKILDEAPHRLREVSGIGEKKYEEIVKVWGEAKRDREVLLFLKQLGLSDKLAGRIKSRYGERTIEVLSADPYILIDELWGVGFSRADAIAAALGVAKDSAQRIRAGLLHELKRGGEDGHIFLTRDLLLRKVQTLLGVDVSEEIGEILRQASFEGLLIIDDDRVYSLNLFQAEGVLARAIASLISQDTETERRGQIAIPEELVSRMKDESQVVTGGTDGGTRVIRLSDEQRRAIEVVATSSLSVITGGPGCGKTTVVRTISQMFRAAGLRLKLAAPTGRASQRLSEVCGFEASTIHRMLKFDPGTRDFVHGPSFPLECDVIIVDESSMIDIPLAAALFSAIPAGARVIVVGDADQLPSVGPGLFLADLLALEQVPQIRLTNLFRRSEESFITYIAHQINAGDIPEIPQPDGITKSDCYFLPVTSQEEGATLIEKLVSEQIPKKFGFKGGEIAVLTPMNQGELGVIQLNQRLQSRLVPLTNSLPRVKVGNIELRLGDRVCQRVNNYQIVEGGVFNGEQGEVVGIDAESQSVFVRFWDGREVEYRSDTLPQLDLAYALSIHRSQGSEVPAVVIALHEAHSILLERQLVYTAITRAKKLLIIVGSRRAFILAVKRMRSRTRNTTLVKRVLALVSS